MNRKEMEIAKMFEVYKEWRIEYPTKIAVFERIGTKKVSYRTRKKYFFSKEEAIKFIYAKLEPKIISQIPGKICIEKLINDEWVPINTIAVNKDGFFEMFLIGSLTIGGRTIKFVNVKLTL